MEPNFDRRRKLAEEPNPPRRRLLTVRSALIFLLALLTALVGVALLLAAHTSVPLAVYSGFGILAAAILFYDRLIESE
jgi:hypothetical protein